jgi:hypothetical protein
MPETPLARIEADNDTITHWLHEYAREHGYDQGVSDDASDADHHFCQFGGYDHGEDTLNEVIDTARALSEAHPGFEVTPVGNSEGTVDGFMVEAKVEGEFFLTLYLDWTDITEDRTLTGLAAALCYARALIIEFNRLVDFAVEKGLAPPPTADATVKFYNHGARPDDDPEPGDRCKDCGDDVTWVGPDARDWLHVDDPDNREHDEKRADRLAVGDV